MSELLPWISAGLSLVAVVLLAVLLLRSAGGRPRRIENALREELRIAREESAGAARSLRQELADGSKRAIDTNLSLLRELGAGQSEQLEKVAGRIKELTESNAAMIEGLRTTVDGRLEQLQKSNEKKLDQMRETVDEKLQSTLEKRLGESFKIVSDNLEAVQKGLGEMRSLATGVGDLKKVLTNVKARGTWGEVQLGAILEQILTPDQFAANVQTKEGSRDTVEYAIRLPGRDDDPEATVWLPVDAKFPQEDYLRLVAASDAGDSEAVQRATDALLRSIRASAKEIHDKYLDPPHTTDFAILFLPTEGLYAEVLRQPGQVEELQQSQRVVVAGPTTLSAILSSLRMGFRTLAIERRSSEVWKVLAGVKTEFGKFGDVLSKVGRQLETARNTIEKTGVRTRAMERKLREVEQLPPDQAQELLGLPADSEGLEVDSDDDEVSEAETQPPEA
jgi:DNA recombination protein RmuC